VSFSKRFGNRLKSHGLKCNHFGFPNFVLIRGPKTPPKERSQGAFLQRQSCRPRLMSLVLISFRSSMPQTTRSSTYMIMEACFLISGVVLKYLLKTYKFIICMFKIIGTPCLQTRKHSGTPISHEGLAKLKSTYVSSFCNHVQLFPDYSTLCSSTVLYAPNYFLTNFY
jgi:hypothetical protein